MINTQVPSVDIDLFSDKVLRDPYDVYAEMRELGPVVWIERHQAFALPRHAEVKIALNDHATFISGKGVGLSDFGNKTRVGTPIASDPPLHTLVRGIVADRLSLRAVREITSDVQEQADRLVEDILGKKTFDGVSDFARRFPLMIMADLIGLPQDGREHLLGWADAGFNLFGPANERTARSQEKFAPLVEYIRSLEQPGRLSPGSIGAQIFDAAKDGRLEFKQCAPLMVAYLMAGLDTTINAISAALMLFGQHPEQWDIVRDNPKILSTGFNEVVRLESPIQKLRRVVSSDTSLAGVHLPADASVLIMYGSANRDERAWPNATKFDVTRNPVGHMAFGVGIHNCPGQILARLETVSLLTALAKHVRRIEVGKPEWHLNNVIRGLERLPVSLMH